MIIPIELRFKADKGSKSAFRTEKTIKSHDVNSVEFHISIEGLELTDNHTAKILSVFHSSKSQANVNCEIVEGKIIYKPDTNLISRHEHVTNYVYVYNGNQSLDVREFIYIVDLSKIDETSLEVKEVYDQSYADLLADFEQALSDYKDSLPQADSVRADIDKILKQFSVDSQVKLSQYDADAQQVITDNQTAFELAETGRQEDFDTSQSERQQRFNDAQSARQESYDQTQSLINEAEESRVEAEGNRDSAEKIRKANESDRVQAEINRENTEDSREQSEGERKTNEEARELSEDERESAEAQRKIDHANRSAELAGKADKVIYEYSPTMLSGYVGGSAGKEKIRVYKDSFGFVHISGRVEGSKLYESSNPIFNLPAELRPLHVQAGAICLNNISGGVTGVRTFSSTGDCFFTSEPRAWTLINFSYFAGL